MIRGAMRVSGQMALPEVPDFTPLTMTSYDVESTRDALSARETMRRSWLRNAAWTVNPGTE